MSTRQSGAIKAVEVMLNGSLSRIETLKGKNREALYDEYKEWLMLMRIMLLMMGFYTVIILEIKISKLLVIQQI